MKRTLLLIYPLVFLSACQRDTSLPEPAVQTNNSTEQALKIDTQKIVHCGDAAFLRLNSEQQLAALKESSVWNCSAQTVANGEGNFPLHCTPAEPQRVFGERIFDLYINQPDGVEAEIVMSVQGDANDLRGKAAGVWKQAYTNQIKLNADGAYLKVDASEKENETWVRCVLPAFSKADLQLPEGWQNAESIAYIPAKSKTFITDTESDEGVAKLSGDALKNALPVCGADYWLAADFAARLAQLKSIGVECNKTTQEGGMQAECLLPPGIKSFGGYDVEKFIVYDEGNVHEANYTVRASAKDLAAAMAKDTMTELTEFGKSAGMYVNLVDDRYRYIVWPGENDAQRSVLNCRMSETSE